MTDKKDDRLNQSNTDQSSLNRTKTVRLYISRPQDQELLRSVSAQLGSINLNDGLQHIFNCFRMGHLPAGITASQAQELSAIAAEIGDDFDSVVDWGSDD